LPRTCGGSAPGAINAASAALALAFAFEACRDDRSSIQVTTNAASKTIKMIEIGKRRFIRNLSEAMFTQHWVVLFEDFRRSGKAIHEIHEIDLSGLV
jgi:hypothetical protein